MYPAGDSELANASVEGYLDLRIDPGVLYRPPFLRVPEGSSHPDFAYRVFSDQHL